MFRLTGSIQTEDSEDSLSQGSQPSTNASEDSVEMRVGGVSLSPPQQFLSKPVFPLPAELKSPAVFSSVCASSHNYTAKIPSKLRNNYDNRVPIHLSQVLPQSQTSQSITIAAAATHDNSLTVNSSSKLQDEHVHPAKRRKLSEPRKRQTENHKKRQHSPSPERQDDPPLISLEALQRRSLKKLKVSSYESFQPRKRHPSNLVETQSIISPPFLSPVLSLPATSPPIPSPSIGLALLSRPAISLQSPSPTLNSALQNHLKPLGFLSTGLTPPGLSQPGLLPPGILPPSLSPALSYQQYINFLASMTPNSLTLLQNGLKIPPYSPMPLLLVPPPHAETSPFSVPSPPKTTSSTPSQVSISPPIFENSPSSTLSPLTFSKLSDGRFEDPHGEEPISLVKREVDPVSQCFNNPSLVKSSNLNSANKKPLSTHSKVSKKLSPLVQSDASCFSKVKPEPGSQPFERNKVENLMAEPSKTLSDQPSTSNSVQQQNLLKQKQRNYKNMTRERRVEANARERTRVHTISSAYDKLRQAVPSYSHTQKLSKLSLLRIAASYIQTLSKIADDTSEPKVTEWVNETTKTIQFEGKAKKKKED